MPHIKRVRAGETDLYVGQQIELVGEWIYEEGRPS